MSLSPQTTLYMCSYMYIVYPFAYNLHMHLWYAGGLQEHIRTNAYTLKGLFFTTNPKSKGNHASTYVRI